MLRELSIGDVSDKGKRFPVVDGPFGTQLHADEYVPEGVPLVRIVNLSFNGKFYENDLVYITENKFKELIRSEIVKDDIIIAKTGATIGKSGLFPLEKGLVASSCLKLSPDINKVDPKYLLYLITSFEGQKKIIDGATGSTRTTINITPFTKIRFNFPEPNEQKQITEILSTADEAIGQTEKLIAKYQRIKTGLMQDLLTKGIDEHGNIRNKTTHKFVVKKGIEVPEEWEVKQLNDCIDKSTVITYGIVQTGPHIEDGVRVLRTIDLQGERIISTNLLRTTEQISNSYKRTILKKYDIVCNVRASVGDFNIIDDENLVGCNTTRGVARISPHKEIDPYYLLWYLRTEKNKRQMELLIKGTTFIDINIADLRKIPVPFPVNLGEQQKISNKLNQISNLIESTRIKLNKLHLIKTGLMQDLLSGRVRVKISEEEANG